MSVIKSERNESSCLYLHNGLELYKYTLEHYKKLPKEYNDNIKPRLEECADRILFNLIYVYRIQITNLYEFQERKDILVETNAWLEKMDTMLSILKLNNHIEDRILVPWEVLIDKEFELIRKQRDKDLRLLNKLSSEQEQQ